MSGIKLMKWVELEPALSTGGAAHYTLELKNDFENVWIKNIRLEMVDLINPAGQSCRRSINLVSPETWSPSVMPQGIFAFQVHIVANRLPPGQYSVITRIDYDIATEDMLTRADLSLPLRTIPA